MISRASAWIELDAAWKSVDNLKLELNKVNEKVGAAERNNKRSNPVRKRDELLSKGVTRDERKPSVEEKNASLSEVVSRKAKKRKIIRVTKKVELPVLCDVKENRVNKSIANTNVQECSPVATSQNVNVAEVLVAKDVEEEILQAHVLNDEKALFDLEQSKSTPLFTSRLYSAINKGNNGMRSLQLLIASQRKTLNDDAEESLQSSLKPTAKEEVVCHHSLENQPIQDEQIRRVSRKIKHSRDPLEYRGFALHGNIPAVWVTPGKKKSIPQQKKSTKTPLFRPVQKKIAKLKSNDGLISTSTWKEGRKLILKHLKSESSAKTETQKSFSQKNSVKENESATERKELEKKLAELFTVKKKKKFPTKISSGGAPQHKKPYSVEGVREFIKKKREERKQMSKEEEDCRLKLSLRKKQGLRNLDDFCRKRTRKASEPSNKYEASKKLWGEKFVKMNESEESEFKAIASVPAMEFVPERVPDEIDSELPESHDHLSQSGIQENVIESRDEEDTLLKRPEIDLTNEPSRLQKLKEFVKEIETGIETETDRIEEVINKSTEIEEEYFLQNEKKSGEVVEKVNERKGRSLKTQSKKKVKRLREIVNEDSKQPEDLEESTLLSYDPYNFISALKRKNLEIFSTELEEGANTQDEDTKRIHHIFDTLRENHLAMSQNLNEHISSWLTEVHHSVNEIDGSDASSFHSDRLLGAHTSKSSFSDRSPDSSMQSFSKKIIDLVSSSSRGESKDSSIDVAHTSDSVSEDLNEVVSRSSTEAEKIDFGASLVNEENSGKSKVSVSSGHSKISGTLSSQPQELEHAKESGSDVASQVQTDESLKTADSGSQLASTSLSPSNSNLSSKRSSSHLSTKDRLSDESISRGQRSHVSSRHSSKSSRSSSSDAKSSKRKTRIDSSKKNAKSYPEATMLRHQMMNEISRLDFLSEQLQCFSDLNAANMVQMSSLPKQVVATSAEQNGTYFSDFEPPSSSQSSSIKENISQPTSASSVSTDKFECNSPDEQVSDSSNKKLSTILNGTSQSSDTARHRIDEENGISKTDESAATIETSNDADLLENEKSSSRNSSTLQPHTKSYNDYRSEMKRLKLERWRLKLAQEKFKIENLNLIKKKLEEQGDEERARMIVKAEKRIIKKLTENRRALKMEDADSLANKSTQDKVTSLEISSKVEEGQSSSLQDSIPEAVSSSSQNIMEECPSPAVESSAVSAVSTEIPSVTPSVSSQKATTGSITKNSSTSKSGRSRRGSLSLRLRSHPLMQDSSVSDESATLSQSETDFTDLEVRIYALKEELRQRKSVAERLKSELKKQHRETLKKKEESLKKQIEAYDLFIQQTTEQLSRELEASSLHSVSVVKPKIRQPHRYEHRQDSVSNTSLQTSQSLESHYSKYEDTFTGSSPIPTVESKSSSLSQISSQAKTEESSSTKNVSTEHFQSQEEEEEGTTKSENDFWLAEPSIADAVPSEVSKSSRRSFNADTVLSFKEGVENASADESLVSVESFSSAVDCKAPEKEGLAERLAEDICSKEIGFALGVVEKKSAYERLQVVDRITESYVKELLSGSISCILGVGRERQLQKDRGDGVSKRVTSIMSCLNERKATPKCCPQDLMKISSVESEADWFSEKADSNVAQVQIEEPEWFDDDIGLGIRSQEPPPPQQQQQFPSYYYRKIPDKPPPPYSPVRAAESAKPAWCVPRDPEGVGQFVGAALENLFEVSKSASLRDAVPTPEFLASESGLSDVEIASRRAFGRLLFDLAKENALEVFSDGEGTVDPWMKPKRLTKRPRVPECKEDFETALRGRVRDDLCYLSGPSPSAGKFGSRQRERVGLVVLEEMQREEQDWNDFDRDEVGVKFQVADDVFSLVLREALASILSKS